MRRLIAAVALWLALAGAGQAACRLALVLALDISGSVNAEEYRQQVDGLAGALEAPAVRQAFFAMPGATVDLAVFEWSGPGSTRTLVEWTTVRGRAALDQVTRRLRGVQRVPGPPSTALGAAMLEGARRLSGRPACWRHVLDVSGDGKSNTGPRPHEVRTDPALADITINGLVVGSETMRGTQVRDSETAELSAYFNAWVIKGPDAFVEVAVEFTDYRAAMERKLLRELQVLALGRLNDQ